MTEAALHRAVAKYLAAALKPPVLWTSIDAGAGRMSKRSAGDRKARGVQRGWPDILIMQVAMCGYVMVLGIELKTKIGRQTAEQKAMREAFSKTGAFYQVCRSIEDVQAILLDCDFPLHARLS